MGTQEKKEFNDENCSEVEMLPEKLKTEQLLSGYDNGTSEAVLLDATISNIVVEIKNEPGVEPANSSSQPYIKNMFIKKEFVKKPPPSVHKTEKSPESDTSANSDGDVEDKVVIKQEIGFAADQGSRLNAASVEGIESICSNSDCNMEKQCMYSYSCSKCGSLFAEQHALVVHLAKCKQRDEPIAATSGNKRTLSNRSTYKQESRHNTKKLIEQVKSSPCLYDPNNKEYNNSQLKEALWATIAIDCNFSGPAAAKQKWQKLRDVLHTLQQQPHMKKNYMHFKYQKQMEFLVRYLNSMDTNTTIPIDADKNTNAPVTIVTNNKPDNDVLAPTPAKKSKRASIPKTVTSTERATREPTGHQKPPSQPLDLFFVSMCETTKHLPLQLQFLVKRRVFQAVIDAEEMAATIPEPTNDNSFDSNGVELVADFSVNNGSCPAAIDNASSPEDDEV